MYRLFIIPVKLEQFCSVYYFFEIKADQSSDENVYSLRTKCLLNFTIFIYIYARGEYVLNGQRPLTSFV